MNIFENKNNFNYCIDVLHPEVDISDLILGPIIGGLTSNSANFWARADGEGILHVWMGTQKDLSDAYHAGQSHPLKINNGFAGVAPVKDLSPNTQYYYSLSLLNQKPDPSHWPYPVFSTFPVPGEKTSFSFAFGSCFRPIEANSGEIFDSINDRREKDNLRFALYIGDQIYADAKKNNGLGKIASNLNEYRKVYEHAWNRPQLKQLFSNLPSYMTLDDHEVDDDWYWTEMGPRRKASIPWWNRFARLITGAQPRNLTAARTQDALKAYWEHQAMHASYLKNEKGNSDLPKIDHRTENYTLEYTDEGSFAYSFDLGDSAFFVMDTRTRRVRPSILNGKDKKTMLGDKQWEYLQNWLLKAKETSSNIFLVTSSSLLGRLWIDRIFDRWAGFPSERRKLLEFLAENNIENVYLLSGDLHSAHAISANIQLKNGKIVPIQEFCSSPLEQSPNWISKFTFNPFNFDNIKNLKRHFSIAKPNFGIVRVNYFGEDKPQVSFEVYGKKGKLINSLK